MQIQWLRTNQDISSSGIAKIYLTHSLLLHENKKADNKLCFVFNELSELEYFLAATHDFDFRSNKIDLQLGIINKAEKVSDKSNFSELDVQDAVIFFGNSAQENSFLKIFDSRSALISNKCNGKYRTIGYQRHLSSDIHHQSVSLGEFKTDFGRAESYLRAAQAIFFDMNAIRRQDSYYKDSFITGLDIYEACQIIRFCGMSTDHSFMFINISDSKSGASTWDCVATMIWYYLEGKNQMEIDHPEHKENNIYLVENELFLEPICFIRAYQTKRWWFIHPESKEKIPCSENDYQSFRQGKIPELLLNLFVS